MLEWPTALPKQLITRRLLVRVNLKRMDSVYSKLTDGDTILSFSLCTRQDQHHNLTTRTRSYLHWMYYSAVATSTPNRNMTCDWQIPNLGDDTRWIHIVHTWMNTPQLRQVSGCIMGNVWLSVWERVLFLPSEPNAFVALMQINSCWPQMVVLRHFLCKTTLCARINHLFWMFKTRT